MHKLNKQQKYLNYKLTTLKGVTVPQGYADGTMDAEEAANYLGRVGISNGFYEKFALKAVTVEDGVKVISPTGKEYFPGQPIWGASQYDDWEEFRSYVETGTSEWQIEPYEGPEQETTGSSEPKVDPEKFGKQLEAQLKKASKGLDLNKIETIAEKFAAQIDALAQTDPQEAQKYKEVIDKVLSDALMRVVGKKKIEQAMELDKDLSMQQQQAVEKTVQNYDTPVQPEVNTFKNEMTFTVGTEDGVHLGGFISVLRLSGSEKLMTGLIDKLEQAYIDFKQTGSKIKLTVGIDSMFPQGLTDEAKEVYSNILSELSADSFRGTKDDIAKVVSLAKDLASITKEEKERERGKIAVSGTENVVSFGRLKELLDTIQSETPEGFVAEALNDLEAANTIYKFRESLDTRNLELQSVIDMCMSASMAIDTDKLKDTFEVVDRWSDTLGGQTLSEVLKKHLSKKSLDEDGLRKELRELTQQFPLRFKPEIKMNVENLRKYRDEMMDSLGLDYYSSFVNSILRGGKLSFGATVRGTNLENFYNQEHDFGRKRVAEFYQALAENIRDGYEIAGNKPLVFKQPVLIAAVEKTIEEISAKHGQDPNDYQRTAIIEGLRQKFRGSNMERYKSVITNYFGTGEFEGTYLEGKAREGVESLITFSFLRQMPIAMNDSGMGNSTHIANLMTFIFKGDEIEFDDSLGSFISRDTEGLIKAYTHANILVRGRFIDGFAKKPDGTYGLTIDDTQRKIFEDRIQELRGLGEVTDNDIVNYIATTSDFLNPSFLLASTIRANSTFSDLLPYNEAVRMRDNFSVETSSKSDSVHSSMTSVNGTRITSAATSGGILNALEDKDVSIGSVASSLHEMKKDYVRARREETAGKLLSGDLSSLDFLGSHRESVEKLLKSKKVTEDKIVAILKSDDSFDKRFMDKFHGDMNISAIETKINDVVSSRLSGVNEEGKSIISTLIQQTFESAKHSQGHTGHAMEMLSFIPALHAHMKDQDISNVEFVGDSEHMSSVVKWTAGGKEFMFAKPQGTGGTIDSMIVEIENGEAHVFPYEAKMEKAEGAKPHIGNPHNYFASLTELWSGSNIRSIKQRNIVALDVPHSEGDAQAYEPMLSLSTPTGEDKHYVATGQSAATGTKNRAGENIIRV